MRGAGAAGGVLRIALWAGALALAAAMAAGAMDRLAWLDLAAGGAAAAALIAAALRRPR